MMRRVAVLTTSRADWSHLVWPLRAMEASANLAPELIVAGAHLSPEFGTTVEEIRADGFTVHAELEGLLSSDSDLGMAKTIGVLQLGLADILARRRPDLLFLVADRYEMLAPAAVGLALRLPMVHLEGGEVSRGAVDDAVRNALTKLAHVHLTPTARARRRVLALGEEPSRVHEVGAPSLDHLVHAKLPDRATLEERLGLRLEGAPTVVAVHPVTLDPDPAAEPRRLFEALARWPGQLICVFPNADAGSRALIAEARSLAGRRDDLHVRENLAAADYWGLLREAGLLVGNSSSGIMEAASLELPTIDVGRRQEGRDRARNVIDAPAEPEAILAAGRRARDPAFRASLRGLSNPYGDGHASERIVRILENLPDRATLLAKPPVRLREDDAEADQRLR